MSRMILALALSLSMSSCGMGLHGSRGPTPTDASPKTAPQSPTESAAQEGLSEVDLAQAAGLITAARQAGLQGDQLGSHRLLLRLVRDLPGAPGAPEAALELAEAAMSRGDWTEAERHALVATSLPAMYPENEDSPADPLGPWRTLAFAYEAQGHYQEAAEAWSSGAGLSPLPRVDLASQARTLLLAGRAWEALELLEPLKTGRDIEEGLLSGPSGSEGMMTLRLEALPHGPWRAWLSLVQARSRCLRADLDGCEEAAAEAAQATDISVSHQASELLERVGRWREVVPKRLGLLVPAATAVGKRTRRAVELGMKDHRGIELVVMDTKGTPEGARQAVEAMVLEHHVAALLGPVGPRETGGAAEAARQWQVPMVTLTRSGEAGTSGAGIWRVRFTPQEHGAALARHVRLHLGDRTAAILVADSPYARRFMGAFWDTFVSLGGDVISVEPYGEESTNPERRSLVRRVFGSTRSGPGAASRPDALVLIGRGHMGRRQREDLEEMKAILSHTKSLGIPLRTDPSRSGAIQVLGDATWNDRMAIDLGEYLTDNALFVDGYVDTPGGENKERFRSRIYASYGRRAPQDRHPTSLDAIAYDAARLLAGHLETFEGTDHRSRLALTQQLSRSEAYEGVTGPIELSAAEAPGRRPWILTVDGDEIRPRDNEENERSRDHGASP